jgi:SNF2 family DNA or RNA helicase
MLIDNKDTHEKDSKEICSSDVEQQEKLKAWQWISKFTEQGHMDMVTGYFTIGALAWLARVTNSNISRYRFVLGDIVSTEVEKERPLNLLNEHLSVEAAVQLSAVAREAVEFLRQNQVEVKTLEPNFCHAKLYLHASPGEQRFNYYMTGSSNLTEAGLGMKQTQNVELNVAETGKNSRYQELQKWFDNLWKQEQAHTRKTLRDKDGKRYTVPFKEYLIEEISKVFKRYEPKGLYYKVLFELFGAQMELDKEDPEFTRQVVKLENTQVFQDLYPFQKSGALSIIKMLQRYNGAILADAVGLGKTWTALAVMKFFQDQKYEVVLLCPKKLHQNWVRYRRRQGSRFESDNLDFYIRYHSDLQLERLDKPAYRAELADVCFVSNRPRLFVIDESHNLRNDKSQRYKFLVEEILKRNDGAKVLLLTATPINNTLNDIRNQFKLMVQGDPAGFRDTLKVKNLDYTFRIAQHAFREWRESPNPRIRDFIKTLPDNFFKLTDALTVSRTRAMISDLGSSLCFPVKEKPMNLFVTPNELGNFESFEELFQKFPPMLSGYQPSFYAEPMEEKKQRLEEKKQGNTSVSVMEDEIQRDKFLVKMMYILMVKRLESSWHSFYETVKRIRDHHQNALEKIRQYEDEHNRLLEIEQSAQLPLFDDEEQDDILEAITLGKKRKVSLSEIDKAGNLKLFKKDLKKDQAALDNLVANLERFAAGMKQESVVPDNRNSSDLKLEALMQQIIAKQQSGKNHDNRKVVIFTVYRDTARYLFEQLKQRGFTKIAMISGTGSATDDHPREVNDFEPILERFAPYTKLFREKKWDFISSAMDLSPQQAYHEWIRWVAEHHPGTYEQVQHPLEILIATDVLSEGQNLQDADMVINYDIHWNPVRIIQRMGRIDRLGSPNETICGVNFWPSNNINSYLDLQGRIEQRMAAMKLAGSEVDLEFSDTFKEMAEDEQLENRLKKRMLEQMQTTWDDIEVSEKGLGFNNLSLEQYRAELLTEFMRDTEKYAAMPNGVYTGFLPIKEVCAKPGIIALLGYPARPQGYIPHGYKSWDLIYIDMKGKPVLINHKEVLDALNRHKEHDRSVPEPIDKGEAEALEPFVEALKAWIRAQGSEEQTQPDGTTKETMSHQAKDILSRLSTCSHDAITRIKQNETVESQYQPANFDLIVWFVVGC